MKAILVMEMPKDCTHCPLFNASDECVMQSKEINYSYDSIDELEAGCPLVPMPEWKNYEKLPVGNPLKEWGNGWNACLDTIEGRKA